MFTLNEEHINEVLDDAIALRRHLHENPELSNQEFETSKLLKEKCKELGLEIHETENTGFIAILDSGKPGKTVGLRTDIDALPIDENPENLNQKKKWVSKVPNVMQACGHDGHMAIAMGSLEILAKNIDKLTGKVIFIFEEGEENNTGIHIMVDFLKENNYEFDVIYGNHTASFVDTGKVVIKGGPIMAGQRAFGMTVKGQSGHGSRPDLAINPVFAGAQILTAWTNAWANQVDVTKTVTLGVTQFHGGEAFNIIPSEVMIGGSLRYFDKEAGEEAFEILKRVAKLTAEVHKTELEIDELPGNFLDAVVNDEEYAQIAHDGLAEIYPDAPVEEPTWFASETFSGYQALAPTCFSLVGIRSEAVGSGAEHHNERFDLDDDALKYGIAVTTNFAVKVLNQS